MQHRTITARGGSQWESWHTVFEDGRIELHTENDGCAFLRHGPEATDRAISVAEVEAMGLAGAALAALAEMAGGGSNHCTAPSSSATRP